MGQFLIASQVLMRYEASVAVLFLEDQRGWARLRG